MLLQKYDITFVHIKGKGQHPCQLLSPDFIQLDIYEKAIETQHLHAVKTATTQQEGTIKQIQHIDPAPLPQSLNMNSATLHTLQKQDKFCRSKST